MIRAVSNLKERHLSFVSLSIFKQFHCANEAMTPRLVFLVCPYPTKCIVYLRMLLDDDNEQAKTAIQPLGLRYDLLEALGPWSFSGLIESNV